LLLLLSPEWQTFVVVALLPEWQTFADAAAEHVPAMKPSTSRRAAVAQMEHTANDAAVK
jgi:hypothetical protein